MHGLQIVLLSHAPQHHSAAMTARKTLKLMHMPLTCFMPVTMGYGLLHIHCSYLINKKSQHTNCHTLAQGAIYYGINQVYIHDMRHSYLLKESFKYVTKLLYIKIFGNELYPFQYSIPVFHSTISFHCFQTDHPKQFLLLQLCSPTPRLISS